MGMKQNNGYHTEGRINEEELPRKAILEGQETHV